VFASRRDATGTFTAPGPYVSPVSEFFTPDFPVFVGGSVAVLCWFIAALLQVTAPSSTSLSGFAFAFLALGVAFLALGLVVGAVVWVRNR
jgi:hypothetical protein